MPVKKILVCDDDDSIVDLIAMVLAGTGASIVTQTQSTTLYDRVVKEQPDLLIIDIWMPVITGDMVIKRIRDDEVFKDLPIIAISAGKNGNDVALNAGATCFLPKPFDIDELVAEAESLL